MRRIIALLALAVMLISTPAAIAQEHVELTETQGLIGADSALHPTEIFFENN